MTVPSNQRSVPFMPLPENLLPARNRIDRYRSLVSIALNRKLPPLPVELKGVERQSIFIPPLLDAKIEALAEKKGLSYQQCFAGLTLAGIEHIDKEQSARAGVAEKVKAPFKNAKPDQLRYYQGLMSGLEANKITLAEASTGIGKGRAMVAAGIMSARKGKTPVLISAPTLKILGQLWLEMEILRKEGLCKRLKIAFFPGASEFVSDERLRDFMEEHDDDPDVADWLNKGGVMLQSDNPLHDAMTSFGINPAWFMEDLRSLAINMPVNEFALRKTDEGQASKLLTAIRDKAKGADIIFCTHAMLAYSQQSKWALLPEPSVLIIDEAHLLEKNIAAIHCHAVSLYSLEKRLKKHLEISGVSKGSATGRAIRVVQSLFKILQNINNNGKMQVALYELDAKDSAKIKENLEQLVNILNIKSVKEVEQVQRDYYALQTAVNIINGTIQDRAYIQFSPDRRFPSLLTGKGDIGNILGHLWKTAMGGAVLASATLYVKDSMNNSTCDYIAGLLAIPAARVYSPAPIVAKWVTETPILHLPSADKVARLSRPNTKEYERPQKAVNKWLSELAKEIAIIQRKTLGGTLVLTTSYAQVNKIHKQLIINGVSKKRIVVQKPNEKFTITEDRYRSIYIKGQKPILIGLGGAWTGVDLCDKSVSPKDDNLLTDLIIACCPLGLNKTNTMLYRIEKQNIHPIIKEALMQLKQGLGRLMRNGRQRNKNIWILDGRLWSDWKGMRSFQQAALLMLNDYKNQKNF